MESIADHDWTRVQKDVTTWVLEAGKTIKDGLMDRLDVQSKSDPDDLVTNMDKQIEKFFIDKIRHDYPNDRIVSEEGFGDDVSSDEGVLWLIDPIDGTMNFVHQQRHFSISVGIYENGVGRVGVIYDVMADDLYHCIKGEGAYLNKGKLKPLEEGHLETAIIGVNATWVNKNHRIDPDIIRPIASQCRGTRSYGSAAIELAYIASGIMDAYLTMRLSPWDYGAGFILIEEVGGVGTKVNGEPINLLQQNSLLIGKKGVHDEMIHHIKTGIAEGKFIENQQK